MIDWRNTRFILPSRSGHMVILQLIRGKVETDKNIYMQVLVNLWVQANAGLLISPFFHFVMWFMNFKRRLAKQDALHVAAWAFCLHRGCSDMTIMTGVSALREALDSALKHCLLPPKTSITTVTWVLNCSYSCQNKSHPEEWLQRSNHRGGCERDLQVVLTHTSNPSPPHHEFLLPVSTHPAPSRRPHHVLRVALTVGSWGQGSCAWSANPAQHKTTPVVI